MTASSSVSEAIISRFPASLELLVLALIPIVMVGSRLGIRAAMHPDGVADSVFGFFSIVGWATPDYIMALLILVGSFSAFGWLPIGSLSVALIKDWNSYTNSLIIDSILNLRFDILLSQLANLAQPVLTLFLVHSAYVFQISRATALDVKKRDFVRAARSRGVSERTIMLKHVRKNVLIPVVTVGGELFASLFTGLAFVETIFARPGIGRLLTDAAISVEVLTLSGCVLLIAAMMIIVNIVVDIIYSFLDPRILLWDNGRAKV
ncbi:ABC transporter permease [Mesotoga sp.]